MQVSLSTDCIFLRKIHTNGKGNLTYVCIDDIIVDTCYFTGGNNQSEFFLVSSVYSSIYIYNIYIYI
jgi:hypothetical protein